MDNLEKIIHIGIIILLIAAIASGAFFEREPKTIDEFMNYIETNNMELPNININDNRPINTGVSSLDNLGNTIFSLFAGIANVGITLSYGIILIVWAIGFILI